MTRSFFNVVFRTNWMTFDRYITSFTSVVESKSTMCSHTYLSVGWPFLVSPLISCVEQFHWELISGYVSKKVYHLNGEILDVHTRKQVFTTYTIKVQSISLAMNHHTCPHICIYSHTQCTRRTTEPLRYCTLGIFLMFEILAFAPALIWLVCENFGRKSVAVRLDESRGKTPYTHGAALH